MRLWSSSWHTLLRSTYSSKTVLAPESCAMPQAFQSCGWINRQNVLSLVVCACVCMHISPTVSCNAHSGRLRNYNRVIVALTGASYEFVCSGIRTHVYWAWVPETCRKTWHIRRKTSMLYSRNLKKKKHLPLWKGAAATLCLYVYMHIAEPTLACLKVKNPNTSQTQEWQQMFIMLNGSN